MKHATLDKENCGPNQLTAPNPTGMKRKAPAAAGANKKICAKGITPPEVTLLACNMVKGPSVMEVEDADVLSIDELFALRFTAGRFQHKERLAERQKFIKVLKDRLVIQVAEVEAKEKAYAKQEETLSAAIEALDKRTLELEEQLISAKQSEATAEGEQAKAAASLAVSQGALEQAQLTLAEKTVVLDAVRSNIRAAQETISAAQEELAASKSKYEVMKGENATLQEYNQKHQESADKLKGDLEKLKLSKDTTLEEAATVQQELRKTQAQRELTQGHLEVAKAAVQKHEAAIARIENETKELQVSLGAQTTALQGEEAQVTELQGKVDQYRETHGKTQAEFDRLKGAYEALQASMATQGHNLTTMQTELETGQTRLLMADETSAAKIAEFARLQEALEESRKNAAGLRKQRLEADGARREMQNRILDLKGNMRVFCRVQGPAEGSSVAVHHDENGLGSLEVAAQEGTQAQHHFGFDQQFGPEVPEEAIFAEVAEVVTSALDGYKVALLSYGHPTTTLLAAGLLPRTIAALFARVGERQRQGWDYRLHLATLEVQGDDLRDLAAPESPLGELTGAPGAAGVPGCTQAPVSCPAEAEAVLAQARGAARPGCHLVCSFHVTATHAGKGASLEGVLYVADLAPPSEADGNMRALGEVVTATASRAAQVPFKNSKLTQLLQPCLGDHAKTTFLVSLSGAPEDTAATLDVLRFASKVNACHVGRPRKMKA